MVFHECFACCLRDFALLEVLTKTQHILSTCVASFHHRILASNNKKAHYPKSHMVFQKGIVFRTGFICQQVRHNMNHNCYHSLDSALNTKQDHVPCEWSLKESYVIIININNWLRTIQ